MPLVRVWVRRLAVLVPASTLGLIVAGGLVTNTGAALAVPDWPTTFGENPFLYPWSRMVGGILFEHSHRLIGALVGLLTVALAASAWATGCRGWLRRLAALAVILVVVQGLIGGLRVVLLQDTLAIVHGCLAQAFFALTVALAVLTGRDWARPVRALPASAGRLPALAAGTVAAVYGQIVLGALTTHAGWVGWHLLGALAAGSLLALSAHRVFALTPRDAGLRWWAGAPVVLLGLQVALGVGAYLGRFTGWALPGGAIAGVGFPVAHRAVGALLLGAAVALALQVWRRRAIVGLVPAARARLAGDGAAA
jgi:cytochrome c oxidase assembly protein subunit 15